MNGPNMETEMMEQGLTLPAVPGLVAGGKVAMKEFAPSFLVMMPDKSILEVPIDKASNDAKRSLLVARTRKFLEKQLKRLENVELTPVEIKDTVMAVVNFDGLSRELYIAGINNNSAAHSALGAGLREIIKGAAQGAAEGTAAGFMEKMAKMDKAADKVERKIEKARVVAEA